MLRHALSAVICMCGVAVLAPTASAQAPIVYAGASSQAAAAQPASLAGGGETSYGYGAAPRRREGAVIDIRRVSASSPQPQPQQALEQAETEVQPPAPAPSTAERPAWLEQERVGPPYQANGRWYVPTPEPGYEETGMASWYGPQFHGQRTANGEVFDQNALTAAHPTLPLNSLVQVTNLENGREVIVRITDRGPFVRERLIDLSRAAAEILGYERAGHTRVHVRYLGPAPRRVDAAAGRVETAPPAAPTPVEPEPQPPVRTDEEGPTSLLPPGAAPTEVAAIAAPPPVAGGFVVQVGAFSDLANAQRVRDRAAEAGPVSIDVRRTSAGELFRVRVGPFATEAEADAARRALADLGYGESVVASR